MKIILIVFLVAAYFLGHRVRQDIRRENKLDWTRGQGKERPAVAG